MSDTPRTDAYQTRKQMASYYNAPIPEDTVSANFARILELELTAAKNEIARMNGQTNFKCICKKCGGENNENKSDR